MFELNNFEHNMNKSLAAVVIGKATAPVYLAMLSSSRGYLVRRCISTGMISLSCSRRHSRLLSASCKATKITSWVTKIDHLTSKNSSNKAEILSIHSVQ